MAPPNAGGVVLTPSQIQAQIDNFNNKTAFHRINLDTMTAPNATGGITSLTIRRVGLLQGVWLPINITVAGTVNTPNAAGIISAIRRIRLTVNSSGNLIDISGSGYLNMVNEQIGTEKELAVLTTLNQGNTAVSAAAFKLFMYLPVALNRRDVTGLVLLASEQQTVELQIDWADQITVGGTTATYTASVRPQIDILTVPADGTLPPLKYFHQLIEQNDSVTGANDLTINPVRNNIYVSVWHMLNHAVSPSEVGTRLRMIRNGSDQVFDDNVDSTDLQYSVNRARARRAGVWPVDYMASTDQGMLGINRDLFNSHNYTDYQHIITTSATATVQTIRRMLSPIAST